MGVVVSATADTDVSADEIIGSFGVVAVFVAATLEFASCPVAAPPPTFSIGSEK